MHLTPCRPYKSHIAQHTELLCAEIVYTLALNHQIRDYFKAKVYAIWAHRLSGARLFCAPAAFAQVPVETSPKRPRCQPQPKGSGHGYLITRGLCMNPVRVPLSYGNSTNCGRFLKHNGRWRELSVYGCFGFVLRV